MTRRITALLIVLAIIVAPVLAFAVTLTDAEAAQCHAGGGCVQATVEQIKELAAKAYAAGRERGSISCGNRT